MHRDVTFVRETLAKIIIEAGWLYTHCPDVFDLAYGPRTSSGDTVHVQTSDNRDLSDRIENEPGTDTDEDKDRKGPRPQHTWRTLRKKLRAIEIDLSALESMTTSLFAAGQLPDEDRPGRDTTMPPALARQAKAAAARRRARGEWAPASLRDSGQRS